MTGLVIDNREGKIINLIKHLTDYTVEQLSIGDFLIKMGDSTTNTIVVERKSVNDLYQSINDGRYKEQKARPRIIPYHK